MARVRGRRRALPSRRGRAVVPWRHCLAGAPSRGPIAALRVFAHRCSSRDPLSPLSVTRRSRQDPHRAQSPMLDSYLEMAPRHVVVDGSNIATEGRSMPSLAQLDQAVREFLVENPDDIVTVVVDASFGHRIDPSELTTYEEAEAAGEVVSPPAGAIGRGDAFLLRIADRTGATVLSNDSFQEFHGEHDWLFDKGRLVGGKPVPGVGWIFTPRTPVRRPKSREAVKEAKGKVRAKAPSAIPGLDLAAERARGSGKSQKTVERAIAVATEEAVEPKDTQRRRRRQSGRPPAEPVNDPLTFITFIAANPLGATVEGTVDSFASHGAFVEVNGARCYLPLSGMGEPAPRSAREVLARGDTRRFVIQALDPQRRGIELGLPGFAHIAGTPTDETVEAEIAGGAVDDTAPAATGRRRSRKAAEAAAPSGTTRRGATGGAGRSSPRVAAGGAAGKAPAARKDAGKAPAGRPAAAGKSVEKAPAGKGRASVDKAEGGGAAAAAAASSAGASSAATGRKARATNVQAPAAGTASAATETAAR